MISRFITWFILRTCFNKISVIKMMDRIFTAWLNSTKDMNKKEQIVSFINLTLGIVQDRMPMYNVAIAEARTEVVSIMNNNASSEPRMLCPKCKTLIKVPYVGDRRTLSWILSTSRTREVVFNCSKCGYTKPLGITSSY